MIYLIGGAPRVGKSLLCQRLASKLKIGWISTDLLIGLLQVKQEEGVKTEWDAAPQAIATAAEWFFPYLQRFVWGVSSLAEDYIVEGVDFLPSQAVLLEAQYPIRSVFLGRSQMTLEQFERFPGRSRGYAGLPEALRRQIVQDVPHWSAFIQSEADRCGCRYIDMQGDFTSHLDEAEASLMTGTQGQIPRE